MECFKIEWTKIYPLESAQKYIPSNPSVVYVYYRAHRVQGRTVKKIWRIGSTEELKDRYKKHMQEWQHTVSDKEKRKYSVCFGTIYSLEGEPSVSRGQLFDAESLLINEYKPDGNDPDTKKGYNGGRIILISNNKAKLIDEVLSDDKHLLSLLKKKLARRSRSPSSRW